MSSSNSDSDSGTYKYKRPLNGSWEPELVSIQDWDLPRQVPLNSYSVSDQKQNGPKTSEWVELPGGHSAVQDVEVPGHNRTCYCGFNGTEGDAHSDVCDFAPVECLNGCEAHYPRYFMPVHRRSCPKEVIPCVHSDLGCKGTFKREDQSSHDNNKIFHHMGLLCSKAGSKHQEVEEQVQQLTSEKDRNLERIKQLEKKTAELELDRYNFKKMQKRHQEKALSFLMKGFSREKEKGTPWKSESMTSKEGYKFCIGVYANGYSESSGTAVSVELLAMKGENDEELEWQVKAHFTLRLVNFKGGEDKVVYEYGELKKASKDYQHVAHFKTSPLSRFPHAFIEHSKIHSFINDDQLQFELLVVADSK